GKAGVAVAVAGFERLHHAADGEEGQRVGSDVLANLFQRLVGRDQFVLGRHVNAHEAGEADGWAGDAHVHFARARVAQKLYQRAGGVAAHNRVVDHHHALAAQVFGQRVELHGDAHSTQLVGRLDEGAANVAAFDQPFAVGDAALFGKADGV